MSPLLPFDFHFGRCKPLAISNPALTAGNVSRSSSGFLTSRHLVKYVLPPDVFRSNSSTCSVCVMTTPNSLFSESSINPASTMSSGDNPLLSNACLRSDHFASSLISAVSSFTSCRKSNLSKLSIFILSALISQFGDYFISGQDLGEFKGVRNRFHTLPKVSPPREIALSVSPVAWLRGLRALPDIMVRACSSSGRGLGCRP
jgi:hypothetical protein